MISLYDTALLLLNNNKQGTGVHLPATPVAPSVGAKLLSVVTRPVVGSSDRPLQPRQKQWAFRASVRVTGRALPS